MATRKVKEKIKIEMKNKDVEVILGLDISTKCIGVCLYLYKKDGLGEVISMTHIEPKVSGKIKGMEALFLKKNIFEKEFLTEWKDKGIDRVIIEEPLISSNNANTVAALLRFNGMISDSIFRILNIVPEYISSYDARKYAFPELVSIRQFDKLGNKYDRKVLHNSIENNKLTLFASYPWDADKKYIMWNKVMELYPNIEWLYDNHGELVKQNFDANDALITCLAISNKLKYGELDFKISDVKESNDKITFNLSFWDRTIKKELLL